MIFPQDRRTLLRIFAFSVFSAFMLLLQGCALTEEDVGLSSRVSELLAAYPAGTVDSVEEADEVLDAVAYENQMLDYLYGVSMDACTERFLVNACYDEVKFRYRLDRAALKPLSVEADRFKRTEKVRLRDQSLVDAEQEELGKAPERAASRKRHEEKEERYRMEEAQARHEGSERQDYHVQRQAADEASPPRLEDGAYTVASPSRLKNPDTVLTPGERQQNVEAYEAKKAEAERKQADALRKQEETQAKRDRRAAREAAGPTKKQKSAKD